MVVMYGIKNCDTIKKARRWLEAHNIDYRFHDYRADGLDPAFLHSAINELGWEALLNTRPLLCKPGQPMLLGFSETLYSDLFVEV